MTMRYNLLCASLLLWMGQAQAVTLKVTTTADENGENPTACSLREAVKASSTKQAFGGCPAGERYITDQIQLEGKTYALTQGPLEPTYAVTILGALGTSSGLQEPFDNTYPGRLPLTTIIEAQNSRIFDTAGRRAPLTLRALILRNGRAAGHGGAILAGGQIELERVNFENNQASGAGGAIFLAGTGSSLKAVQVNITGSHAGAQQPAVLGMSCFDDLQYTTRTLDLEQLSMTGNGDSQASAILDYCGASTASLTAVTLGQNTVGTATGNAIVRMLNGPASQRRVAPASALTLTSVTLVNNQGAAGIAYDDAGRWTMANSILAFNNAPLQCDYQGSRPVDRINNFSHATNFLAGTPNPVYGTTVTAYATPECEIPQAVGVDKNVYQKGVAMADVLLPLADYNGFTLGYLPNPQSSLLIDKGFLGSGCGAKDQRGAARNSGQRTGDNYLSDIACDLGALEYQQLTANPDSGAVNSSYRTSMDKKPPELTAEERAKLTEDEKKLLARLTDSVADEIDVYTRQFSYRRIYADILTNDTPQEDVKPGSTPASVMNPLFRGGSAQPTVYVISAESLGTAPTVSDNNLLPKTAFQPTANAADIKCQWVSSPKGYFDRLAIWRTDGRVTPAGESERCKYTISYNGRTTTTVIQARVANQAPIAKDDEVTLKYGALSVPLDILANDSDDGDGPIDTNNDKLYDDPGLPGVAPERRGTSIFYLDPLQADPKKQAYIKITQPPALGTLRFEYEAGCPDNTSSTEQSTCYGGKLVYVSSNSYSKFNDSFKYMVYDRDMLPSNEATVNIINTATTTDNKHAGGGSAGVPLLLALLGLALRRTRARTTA